MFYYVFHSSCFSSNIKRPSFCSCLVVASLVPEFFFSPAKSRSNLKFLRCTRVLDMLLLKFCSDVNERMGLQLFIHFLVLMDRNASFAQLNFFVCGAGVGLKFPPIAVLRKHLLLVSKNYSTTNGLTFQFLPGVCVVSLTSYMLGPKFAKTANI